MELLISEDIYGIPIPLLIRNDSFSFNYEKFVRRYSVYMKVRSRLLGSVCLVRKNQVTELTRMRSL